MEKSLLISIYNSYVGRIHDFRREQHAIIIIATGLFALVAKTVIDLKTEAKLQGIAENIFVLVTVVSAIMIILFLNHSYIMLLFSQALRRIEDEIEIPLQLRFYTEHRLGRGISFILSHLLPFALYFALAMFIISVTEIPSFLFILGIGLHLAILFIGSAIFGHLVKKR